MSEPISYATPLPARSKHDVIYTTLLGVLTAMWLMGMIMMGFMIVHLRQSGEPTWVFGMVFATYLTLFLLQVAVIIIRLAFPQYRK